jgi:hypothetical protein
MKLKCYNAKKEKNEKVNMPKCKKRDIKMQIKMEKQKQYDRNNVTCFMRPNSDVLENKIRYIETSSKVEIKLLFVPKRRIYDMT